MSLTLILNGQSRTFETLQQAASLEQLVVELGLKGDRVAVEHNGDIVPRTGWGERELKGGDRLEVVHFVGGGACSWEPYGGADVLGVHNSCIHSETFGAGESITPGIASVPLRTPHPPAEPAGTGPKVSFTCSGLAVRWDSRYGSLLEFAEACDVPVRW